MKNNVVFVLAAAGALLGCDSGPVTSRLRLTVSPSEVLVGEEAVLGVERQRADAAAPLCVVVHLEGPGALSGGQTRAEFLWGGGVRWMSVTGLAPGGVRVFAESYAAAQCAGGTASDAGRDAGPDGGPPTGRVLESAAPAQIDVVIERTTRAPPGAPDGAVD